jgi:hypothetical protein
VFGIFMGRREAVIIGWGLSGFCFGMAGFLFVRDLRLALLLAFVGAYGFVALGLHRRWVLTA